MGERRKLGDQAPEALDTIGKRQPKRRRSWEAGQRAAGDVVTYRGIPAELQARIKAIAGENGVTIGELARRFLEHALADFDAGELPLDAVDVLTKRTLYPGQGS